MDVTKPYKTRGTWPRDLAQTFKKTRFKQRGSSGGGVVREWVSLVVSLGVSLWLSVGG